MTISPFSHPLSGRQHGHWVLGNHLNELADLPERQKRLAQRAEYERWITAHERLQQGGYPEEVFSVKGQFASPIIGHIPHSSRRIPPKERAELLLDDAGLEHEVLRLTDHYTDELFAAIEHTGKVLTYNVSRLVCDPERFWRDEEESAAKMGFGVVYERTTAGEHLRKLLTPGRRDELLDTYYFPYHSAFELLTHECLEQYGNCLIIDCHSFPSAPLPFETGKSVTRPDICIGTDSRHTPPELVIKLTAFFEERRLKVKVNTPFAGTIVPTFYLHRSDNVQTVMLEVNRDLYMDEATGERSSSFAEFKAMISECVEMIKGLCEQ